MLSFEAIDCVLLEARAEKIRVTSTGFLDLLWVLDCKQSVEVFNLQFLRTIGNLGKRGLKASRLLNFRRL